MAVQHWLVGLGLAWGLGLGLSACGPGFELEQGPLNSRFSDRDPALSANGRYLALVTNRSGRQTLALFDLRSNQFVPLRGVNRRDAVVENPSVSRSARYLVYMTSGSSEFGGSRPELELYDRVTQRVEVVTRGYRGWVRRPSISPDGRYIVFETARQGQWDVEVLDRGPGTELDLPEGAPARLPSSAGSLVVPSGSVR